MTPKQRDTLVFIAKFMTRNQATPSIAEIKEALGAKSKCSAHRHVSSLEERGYITRMRYTQGSRARGRTIQITDEGWRVINAWSRTGGRCKACGQEIKTQATDECHPGYQPSQTTPAQ